MKHKRNNIFWVSYSDLMTSMFFVMLILFVLSIGYLNERNKENEKIIKENIELIDAIQKQKKKQAIELKKLKKILKIEQQFMPLEQDSSFIYLKECKKFVIKDFLHREIFEPNEMYIKPEYKSLTIEIGKKIEKFLDTLNKQTPDLSYLLVIEGNTANEEDMRWSVDKKGSYVLSYKRALAVYLLWRQNDIDFRKYNAEILISGSGMNGLCRAPVEVNNKRFSIQIIPKVENIKINEKK